MDSTPKGGRGTDPSVAPICIGPRNCEAVIGHTWRWLRDHAAELGVEIIKVDGKPMILAEPLIAALKKRSKAEPVVETDDDEDLDELAEFRRRIARAG